MSVRIERIYTHCKINNKVSNIKTMPTQNNTITKDELIKALESTKQDLKGDIKHTQNVLLAVMLAIFFFLGGILWFTRGDVSDLKAEVQVQQELAELRAQVQILQSE